MFFEISQKSLENTCALFNKVKDHHCATLVKNRLRDRFSCQFCETFNNTILTEQLGATAYDGASFNLFLFLPSVPFLCPPPSWKCQKTFDCILLYYYHVKYVFQSKSILFSCLNVKDLVARNRRDIWSLSDSNRIWTHNHRVCKWTLINLANLPVRLNSWVFIYEQSGCRFESRCCHLQKTFGFLMFSGL